MNTQETNGSESESAELKSAELKHKAISFSHDANAFMDPKIRVLVAEFGLMAYAVWWVILEMLASQRDYKISDERFCEGLHPLVQGKTFDRLNDSVSDCYYHPKTGLKVADIEVGRHRIELELLEALFDRMFEVGLLMSDDSFFWSPALVQRLRMKEDKAEQRQAGDGQV